MAFLGALVYKKMVTKKKSDPHTFPPYLGQSPKEYYFFLFPFSASLVEHKTCDILAAERLRLMRFDNRLIIDSFQEVICILKWLFSIINSKQRNINHLLRKSIFRSD